MHQNRQNLLVNCHIERFFDIFSSHSSIEYFMHFSCIFHEIEMSWDCIYWKMLTLKGVHTVFNSMCQFFFYLIHKIDWDFTWIMIQSWSIHVGTSQLWGSLRPFLNVFINVWHCHTSIKPSNVFKGALQVWDVPIHGSMVNGTKIGFKVAENPLFTFHSCFHYIS